MATAETTETKDRRECEHGDLWLAPDGWWRCVVCTPPHFPSEVVDRRQEQEVMQLSDGRAA